MANTIEVLGVTFWLPGLALTCIALLVIVVAKFNKA